MASSVRTTPSLAVHYRWLDWLRYLSSFLILTYAIRKLIGGGQFELARALSARAVGSLSGFELTWYYYGYSHAYGFILGLTQLVGGLLLLFRRSSLVGAAVLVPLMTNILMINVFFTIAVGAEIAAAVVLTSCLLLLWQKRQGFVDVFWSHHRPSTSFSDQSEKIVVILIAALLLVEAVIFAKHPAH
jgi:hypothetical protein